MTVTTLQTERKTLDTELKLVKEESARFIKDQVGCADQIATWLSIADLLTVDNRMNSMT